MLNRTKEEWKENLPDSVFVKNYPIKRYVENVKKFIPFNVDLDDVVFISINPDVWSSKIAYIMANGTFAALGCCYCISNNHKYDDHSGELWISGIKAIPVSKRISKLDEDAYELDKCLFFCPHCDTIIERWAKTKGIVVDVEKEIDKNDLQQIIQELRSK